MLKVLQEVKSVCARLGVITGLRSLAGKYFDPDYKDHP